MQARKLVTDIERRPHPKVRAYSSSEEREVLVKASQVRGSIPQIMHTISQTKSPMRWLVHRLVVLLPTMH